MLERWNGKEREREEGKKVVGGREERREKIRKEGREGSGRKMQSKSGELCERPLGEKVGCHLP